MKTLIPLSILLMTATSIFAQPPPEEGPSPDPGFIELTKTAPDKFISHVHKPDWLIDTVCEVRYEYWTDGGSNGPVHLITFDISHVIPAGEIGYGSLEQTAPSGYGWPLHVCGFLYRKVGTDWVIVQGIFGYVELGDL